MRAVYPREGRQGQDSAFASVAAVAGVGRALRVIGLSARDFPETAARIDALIARDRKRPSGALSAAARRLLLRLQYNWARQYFLRNSGDLAMCWNGLTGSRAAFMEGARDAGAQRLFLELAPFPGRITLDAAGINAESSVPSARDFYRDWADADPTRSGEDWRRLGEGLVARASRRADVGQGPAGDLSAPFLFVPLQVAADTQMRRFAGWAGGLHGFIEALGRTAAHLPPGWYLRVKEHPSAHRSVAAELAEAAAASGGRIVTDNATDSFAQLAASRAVLTMNSSMGLQAFFYDKPVIATGLAYWAQPGLVVPAQTEADLVTALAAPDTLCFDPLFRAQFMNWLDQVYYPRRTEDSEGNWGVDPAAVARLIGR